MTFWPAIFSSKTRRSTLRDQAAYIILAGRVHHEKAFGKVFVFLVHGFPYLI